MAALTPEEEAELAELNAYPDDAGPASASQILSPFTDVYTGAKELGLGVMKSITAAPEIGTDIPNIGVELKQAVQDEYDPDQYIDPLFGIREQFDKENPATPGWEGWRESGEVLGATTTAGLVTGGLPGAFVGALGGLGSLAGEKIGEGVDYLAGSKNRRFERLGGFAGGFLAPYARGRSVGKTRADLGTPRTREILDAARRQNVPVSDALLGRDKNAPVTGRTFRQQVSALERLAEQNRQGIAGSAGTMADDTPGAVQRSTQAKADAARTVTTNEISNIESQIEGAVGGPQATHDIHALLTDLENRSQPGAMSPQGEQYSRSAATAAELRNDLLASTRPIDAQLDAQLTQRADQLRQVTTSHKTSPSQKQRARRQLDQVNQQIARNRTGISDESLRRINSDIKKRLAEDPAGNQIDYLTAGPTRDAAEAMRRDAAVSGGMDPATYDALRQQEQTLYNREKVLSDRGSDPYEGGDYPYFFGAAGDRAPGRIEAVEAGGQNLSPEMAAQYRIKNMPGGTFDPGAALWWQELDNQAKGLRHRGSPALEQALEDQALISREMPSAPRSRVEADPGLSGLRTFATIGTGNPLMMLVSPTAIQSARAGLTKALGTDALRALTERPVDTTRQFLSQTLANAVQQAQTETRDPVESELDELDRADKRSQFDELNRWFDPWRRAH